jgi:hypothetical protein
MKTTKNTTKPTGKMTAEQVKARKSAYEAQTGTKYVGKVTSTKAAPKKFSSVAEKNAWFAKNAPARASKKK